MRTTMSLALTTIYLLLLIRPALAQSDTAAWRPADIPIQTPWAEDVSPDNAWPEYPRPTMVREAWLNLNGLWDYTIKDRRVEGDATDASSKTPVRPLAPLGAPPPTYDGKILVPYCPESSLSGIGREIRPDEVIWYRRTFEIPSEWSDRHVHLHFGAVDWESTVWINGQHAGTHRGGYIPLTIDITRFLNESGPQAIAVGAWDPTNLGQQSVGKQSLHDRRRGYRYTATTGIWQTVWLEPTAPLHINRLRITPDLDTSSVVVDVLSGTAPQRTFRAEVRKDGALVASGEGRVGKPLRLAIQDVRTWSPADPFLYDLSVTLKNDGAPVDSVASYFGMRKISLGEDDHGNRRLLLNGQPLFQFGPLDQGYWPDSILLPTSDEAARFDVQYLRDVACNMVRKHVTVEPSRWYYWCDKLGLLVWQDMVCTRKFDSVITPESASQWEYEQQAMIDALYNHPSIVMWIVFNEGWGQYDTERLTEWTKEYDPSRLVTCASGWTDFPVGDVLDVHDYSFHPSIPRVDEAGGRAVVLGEVGGFDVLVPGHQWHPEQTQKHIIDPVEEKAREKYESVDELARRYEQWADSLRLLIGEDGLSAAVYTQISDVEHEPNGWLTYDRKVSKIPIERLRAIHQPLYLEGAGHQLEPLVATSTDDAPVRWRYKTAAHDESWQQPRFDDQGWNEAPAPFGSQDRGAATPWDGRDLCLRKTFTLGHVPNRLVVRLVGNAQADFFLNGRLIKGLNTRARSEGNLVSSAIVFLETDELVNEGENCLAVKVHVPVGQRLVDVGLYELQ